MLLALRMEMMMLTMMVMMVMVMMMMLMVMLMAMMLMVMLTMMVLVKCTFVSWTSADSIPGKLPWVNNKQKELFTFFPSKNAKTSVGQKEDVST